MILVDEPALVFLDYLKELKSGIEETEDGRLDGACCVNVVENVENKFRELWGYLPRKKDEEESK